MYVWSFSTIHHERANKIHVHGFPLGPTETVNNKINKKGSDSLLTYFLTYFLFTLQEIYYYINNYFWASMLRLNSAPMYNYFYPVLLPNWRVSAFVRFMVAGLYKKLN